MDKLLVATNRGGISRKSERIYNCLAKHPEGLSPKIISLYTSINVNTIKSILPKMKGIRKSIRGVYLVVKGGDAPPLAPLNDLTSWTFHNCILSCRLTTFPHCSTHSSHDLGLLHAEFNISTIGTATLRLCCDTPLNVSSLGLAFGFFQSLIANHSNDTITGRDVYIRTIEFNRDYSNLRLDGVNCITIDNLSSQFKLYQKKLSLRLEYKTKEQFSAETLIDMLTSNPSSLDIETKLSNLTLLVERVAHSNSMNTKLLMALLPSEE